jgi:hypothetical protein
MYEREVQILSPMYSPQNHVKRRNGGKPRYIKNPFHSTLLELLSLHFSSEIIYEAMDSIPPNQSQRRKPWIETPLIESAAFSKAAGW